MKRKTFFRASLAVALVSVMSAVGSLSHAQNKADFPTRPIKLIVPYGPGGVTDVVTRFVADEASKTLGQAIVVENKPGVNGTLGAMQMVNTEPDGYTLSVVPIGIFRLPHIQKTSYEPLRDLTFISMLAGYSYAIAVRNYAPWKNVADLVEHSRQKPNSISYNTPSTYSSQHLAMVELGRLASVDWTHIPFKGNAEATQNLLSSNVQLIVTSNSVLPYVQNGQIRLLASLEEDKGIGPFGEFSTLKSQSFNVAATSPYGNVGPKNMKPEIVEKLDASFKKAIENQRFQEAAVQLGVAAQYRDHQHYTDYAKQTWTAEKPLMQSVEQSIAQAEAKK